MIILERQIDRKIRQIVGFALDINLEIGSLKMKHFAGSVGILRD